MNKLISWRIQDIKKVYQTFGVQLDGLRDDAERIGISLPLEITVGTLIGVEDPKDDRVFYILKTASEINEHLKVLDKEIARRNSLVGVM